MIADIPYQQYDLEVAYYNQVEQQEDKKITNSLKYRKNNNIYLDDNNNIRKDSDFYLYLILDTMLNINFDHYLTNLAIEYNDRDFGSHAKLTGFANTLIKKISKKFENSFFKIKDRATRISILEYLTNIFASNLAEFINLSDLYIKYDKNKGDYNYQLLISDKLATTKKIKNCYNKYFPIITNMLQNCISMENLLESFEHANPEFNNLWKLFIDKEKQHKGRLFFENEQGYLLNSLRGLAFALNAISEYKYINYDLLVRVGEVIGCNKREDISSSIYLSFRYSAEVLKQLFKKSYYSGDKRAITAMESILNINLDEISSYYSETNDTDPNRIYLAEIINSSLYPYILLSYIGKKSKREYINELFDNYYKSINNISTSSLEQVLNLSLVLCKKLQYLHPLSDGTGRIFLFILLPLLLHQQGFWINSMPEYIWDLLSTPIEYTVAKSLSLCSSALEIHNEINWQVNMSTIDKIYIYCITGDLIKIKEIIQGNYQILNTNIPIVNIIPLEIAVLNNNSDLIKFLLIHTNTNSLHKKITKILNYLKDVNPQLSKLIKKYYLLMLYKPIEEKESFLFD